MIDLQTIAAFAIVAGAAVYVGRDVIGQFSPLSKKADDNTFSACGKCTGCGPAKKQCPPTSAQAQILLKVHQTHPTDINR
jgi:hypothetical protein